MTDRDDLLAFELALHRVSGIRTQLKHQLVQRFDTARDTVHAGDIDLLEAGLTQGELSYLRKLDWRGVERDLAWLENPGNLVVNHRDLAYPDLLKEIHDPPYLIFVKGNASILNCQQISMVGSRRPTAAGKKIACSLARDLVAYGFVVTSGLALGIDSMCHQGALEGQGRTVAVLGNGLDTIYPKKNTQLADAILESGALISEFPVGTPPQRHNFPVRNRIISGLGIGTIVVEAALRSGSLITARLAAEQGRDVFAVPGSILNPMSEGCHWLLKQGARLTESVTDVIEESGIDISHRRLVSEAVVNNNEFPLSMDKNHHVLLEVMGFEPVTVDDLVQTSGLTTAEVSSMLLNMELSGVLESQLDGTFIRIIR